MLENNILLDETEKVKKIISSKSPIILFIGKNAKIENHNVFKTEWGCVVTSSNNIDLMYSFEIRNKRRVYSVTDENISDISLSKKDLNVVFLYGTENAIEHTAASRRRKKVEIGNIFKSIIDIAIDNFGYIFFIGYSENVDEEIDFELIFDCLDKMREGSAFIFEANEDLKSNELYLDLLQRNKIINYNNSLDSLLQEEESNLTYDYEERNRWDKFLYINKGRCVINEDLLHETKSFSILLSEYELKKLNYPKYLDSNYFYKFLKDSATAPVWYAYKNELNLERDFEVNLFKLTQSQLKINNDSHKNGPICIKGQTSSGKSIALANLAYKIYSAEEFPVIYINYADISFERSSAEFCALDILLQELENLGAKNILIIWDNSTSFNQLRDSKSLYTNLKNRGRRFVLVCSSYNYLETNNEDKDFIIHADINISDIERNKFKELLFKKAKISYDKFDLWEKRLSDKSHFLSLLYHVFYSDIGEFITGGVRNEIEENANKLELYLKDKKLTNKGASALTAFGSALLSVGIKLSDFSNEDNEHDILETFSEKIKTFLLITAIFSQYHIKIPLYMALRILDLRVNETFPIVLRALCNVSCISIENVNQDNSSFDYLVSFRTSIEASLYLKSIGCTPRNEIESICFLIENIKTSFERSRYSEISIIDKLIRIIGPNSNIDEVKIKFREFYIDILESLSNVRKKCKLWDTRLICQEVTWTREIYFNSNFADDITTDKLKEAIQLAKETIDILNLEERGKKHFAWGTLTVEMTLSEILRYSILKKDSSKIKRITFDFQSLYKKLTECISIDPMNFYFRNTLLKLFFTYYEYECNAEKQLEYLGRTLSIVDSFEFDLPDEQEYLTHVHNIKRILGEKCGDSFIDELLEKENPIAIFLKAKLLLNELRIDLKDNVNNSNDQDILNVINLIKNSSFSENYEPCQYLLINVFWLYYNKKPIFSNSEKQKTFMSDDKWREFLALCIAYENKFIRNSEFHINAQTIYYLTALSYAQVGDFQNSIKTYRKLDDNVLNFFRANRRKVRHLLCDENGDTKKFRGSIKEGEFNVAKQTGKIKIDNIPKPVHFFAPSMKISNFKGAFTDIEIGLNYIGFEAFRTVGGAHVGKK